MFETIQKRPEVDKGHYRLRDLDCIEQRFCNDENESCGALRELKFRVEGIWYTMEYAENGNSV